MLESGGSHSSFASGSHHERECSHRRKVAETIPYCTYGTGTLAVPPNYSTVQKIRRVRICSENVLGGTRAPHSNP